MKPSPSMPIVYTAALAACAAAIACVNVSLLALSAPSLSRMITRPGRGFALASCAASATLSYSAVPRVESTLRRDSAPSPSCAAVENGESATAREPNATTETSSAPCFAATNERAASPALASGAPRIDCDRSTASTIAFARPRFCSCSPATGEPFSETAGTTFAPAAETTVAWIVGYALVSTPRSETAAPVAAGSTRATSAIPVRSTRPRLTERRP